jgi:peptidoglycan/LPS O-acetylase OafA/YrhL
VAVVLGPVVSTLDWQTYFLRSEFLDYFRNLKIVTIRYILPGVFEYNVYPSAVNGSLWTIPLEVRCFFAMLLLGVIGFMRRPYLVLVGSVLFGIYYFVFAPDPQNCQQHFGLFFLAGVCMDLFRKNWESKPIYLLATIGVVSAIFYLLDAERVALLLLIPTFVIVIGSRSTRILNDFGKYGDISYGIYIYAFPVQQTVLWATGRTFPFLLGLLMTTVITTLCAILSWRFVEGPALGLKARIYSKFKIPTSATNADSAVFADPILTAPVRVEIQ